MNTIENKKPDLSATPPQKIATHAPGSQVGDLISERVKSGLAAAKSRGKVLGRKKGFRPKSDKLAPHVLELVGDGRSYRWIAWDLGISKDPYRGRDRNAVRLFGLFDSDESKTPSWIS